MAATAHRSRRRLRGRISPGRHRRRHPISRPTAAVAGPLVPCSAESSVLPHPEDRLQGIVNRDRGRVDAMIRQLEHRMGSVDPGEDDDLSLTCPSDHVSSRDADSLDR